MPNKAFKGLGFTSSGVAGVEVQALASHTLTLIHKAHRGSLRLEVAP